MSQFGKVLAMALQEKGADIASIESGQPRYSRFDIFKGVVGDDGKVARLRSLGSARIAEGYQTYIVELKTFLNDTFYLLPERNPRVQADYAILTRENSSAPGRKYHWNKIGEGVALMGENAGLVHLCWDLLGTQDIYLNLTPIEQCGEALVQPVNDAA